MKMYASPGGGASVFERSTRVKLEVHPAKTRVMEIKQNSRIINRPKFGRGEPIRVFTAVSIVPIMRNRFYRIVG